MSVLCGEDWHCPYTMGLPRAGVHVQPRVFFTRAMNMVVTIATSMVDRSQTRTLP
jgi:hypothetical protein